jgi:hypothetical protein
MPAAGSTLAQANSMGPNSSGGSGFYGPGKGYFDPSAQYNDPAAPAIPNPPSTGAPYSQYGVTPQQFASQYAAPAAPTDTRTPAQWAADLAKLAGATPQPNLSAGMQAYAGQFAASQQQQQQAINAGLLSAMAGLGQRRDAASKVVAGMPGQFQAIYNEATNGATHGVVPMPANLTPAAKAAEIANNNTNAGERAGYLAAGKGITPLMEAGVTADYSKGVSTLDNTKMQNEAALAQQNQAFQLEMAKSKDAAAAAQQSHSDAASMQQAGFLHDLQMQANTFAHQPTPLTPQQQQDLTNQGNLDLGAQKNGFTNYADQQAATNDPAYQWAISVLYGKSGQTIANYPGGPTSEKAGDKGALIKQLSGNPNILKALVMNGAISNADISAAG